MATERMQKNDPADIILTVKEGGAAVNISTATTRRVVLTSPTGIVLDKAGVFNTDGIDGKLKYAAPANELNEVGTWQAQVYLGPIAGWTGHSDLAAFDVLSNLKEF